MSMTAIKMALLLLSGVSSRAVGVLGAARARALGGQRGQPGGRRGGAPADALLAAGRAGRRVLALRHQPLRPLHAAHAQGCARGIPRPSLERTICTLGYAWESLTG